MKYTSSLMVLLVMLVLSVSVSAQESTSAADRVLDLKAQLLDVQGREETLRSHLAQLDEAIKPENIERSLAGVGSTRPEELREARRKQLTIERNGVLAQLQTLETSRVRLESAIANAEAQAYQESAQPKPVGWTQQMMIVTGSMSRKVMFAGGGLALLAISGGALLYRRKRVR